MLAQSNPILLHRMAFHPFWELVTIFATSETSTASWQYQLAMGAISNLYCPLFMDKCLLSWVKSPLSISFRIIKGNIVSKGTEN